MNPLERFRRFFLVPSRPLVLSASPRPPSVALPPRRPPSVTVEQIERRHRHTAELLAEMEALSREVQWDAEPR